MKKMIQKATAAMVAVIGSAGVAMAQAAPPPAAGGGGLDFSAITAAIDASTIVAALTAIAAIKILPGVARWGFNKVIGWFH